MNTKIYPKSLNGIINIPSSKSIMQRVLICACLSDESTKIINPFYSEEINYIINVLEQLGVQFKYDNNQLIVNPPKKFKTINNKVFCDSASCIHYLLPLICNIQDGITFECNKNIIDRLLDDDFENYCFNFIQTANTITFSKLKVLNKITINSNHFLYSLSGYILSSIMNDEDLEIEFDQISLNNHILYTLKVMNDFGIKYNLIEQNNNTILRINKNQKYHCKEYFIKPDYDIATIFANYGLYNKSITISNININDYWYFLKILDFFKNLGVKLYKDNDKIKIEQTNINNFTVDCIEYNDIIDNLLFLAIISPGKNQFNNINKLTEKSKIKLHSIMKIIEKLNVEYYNINNTLTIYGNSHFEGNISIDVENNLNNILHLIGISTLFNNPITLNNTDIINKNYPGLWETLKDLNASFINE